jgi:hypothetical protein
MAYYSPCAFFRSTQLHSIENEDEPHLPTAVDQDFG